VDEIGDDEPRRASGTPTSPGRSRLPIDPTEKRVLGIPLSWYAHEPVDLSGLRHPVRWLRWRLSRHRNGPYAPSFKEFLAPSHER
jgi:hypothetical protein